MIAGGLTGLVAVVWGLYSGWHLLFSLPVMLLVSLLFAAMGLLTAGWVRQVDQVNVPIFLIIIPMFTVCGTYFPRETLPPALSWVATVLPLSPLIDLLRWPMGLPPLWWLRLLWMVALMVIFATLAHRKIYPQLIR